MPIDSKECFAALTEDGQLWEIYQAASTGGGGAPTGPAGGDLAGTYPNPTVDGLQGNPVSNAIPVNGQVLQFDGTSWVPGAIPSGGSGGGGVVYFLNFNTAADAPVTNIPQTPNASKELGITAETTATSFTSAILSTASYDFLASFVTDLNVPSATAIPAGVWDFNIWAESTTANAANHVLYKIEVLKYDGVNAPVLLATSADSYVYDPQDITQYVSSVVLPQTTILATDRIVVYLYGRATQSNKTITFHFGDGYPTHAHSTMPSVTGTGVVKVVNGVFQSPASTIVNSDVSASAAIDVSKLAMSTNRLLGRTTAGTGAVEEITVGTGLSLSAGTLTNTVTAGVTSVTATAPLTSSGGTTPDISTSIATNRIVGRSSAGTGVMEQLTPVGITVSAGNITGIGGTTGTTDNVIARADGTGGYTVQPSGLIIEDAIVSFTGITGSFTTDTITAPGSAFVTGQPIRFTSLSGGAPTLSANTNYFVVNPSGASFQVEPSIGGGAINFSTDITAGTLLTGHSVSTNVTLSENTTATNSDLVLTPKGTGAFILGPKPDGTATGGNARGNNAIDLQVSRTLNTQVALGANSLIGAGTNNTVRTPRGVICGGTGNIVGHTSLNGSDNFIGGGSSNQCIAENGTSVICAGSSNLTGTGGTGSVFIGAGSSNQASSTNSGVVCGSSNNASQANAFIGGGLSNAASGVRSAIVGGHANAVSGQEGFIGGGGEGGQGNSVTATIGSILGGRRGLADRFGQQSHASGGFAAAGDAQRARFVLRCKTTTNAAVEMALDGGTTYLGIPSGKVIACTINISGVKSDGSAVAHYVRQYAVKNVGGTSSEVYAPVTIGTDNAAGTVIALSANNTDDTLRIAVTGIAAETWRWVASVDAVEIAYGT